MTLEEHEEFGRQIKIFRELLHKNAERLSSKEKSFARHLWKQLGEFRNDLDNALNDLPEFRLNPDDRALINRMNRAYYGDIEV